MKLSYIRMIMVVSLALLSVAVLPASASANFKERTTGVATSRIYYFDNGTNWTVEYFTDAATQVVSVTHFVRKNASGDLSFQGAWSCYGGYFSKHDVTNFTTPVDSSFKIEALGVSSGYRHL